MRAVQHDVSQHHLHRLNRCRSTSAWNYHLLFLLMRRPPRSTLFPYTTLFRSLHNGFSIAACWIVGYRRVFELQALPALHTHPIGTLHPVVVIQRLIGGRRIKRWTVGNILKAWMIERVMVGAQRRGEAMPDMLDQGLLINGHRYRLAHFRVAGQHCV